MNIAIVGGGLAGLTVAHGLHSHHEITIFEAEETAGGSVRSVELTHQGHKLRFDMGFTLYNDWSYPLLYELLNQLQIEGRSVPMGFSVSGPHLDYSATLDNGTFQLEKKLFKPQLWGLASDIKAFQQKARKILAFPGSGRDITLGEYLEQHKFSAKFRDLFILPLGALYATIPPEELLHTRLEFFLKFLDNYGMLSPGEQPQWLAIDGGSKTFIHRFTKPFSAQIRTRTPILKVIRSQEGIEIHPRGETPQYFDRVIMAVPADEALRLLETPTEAEQNILSKFHYQKNLAILHNDPNYLPQKSLPHAIWHFHLPTQKKTPLSYSQNMNLVQPSGTPATYWVTHQSAKEPGPTQSLKKVVFPHFIPNIASHEGQLRFNEINNQKHTFYAGAYWYGGFAEDAIRSGQRVLDSLRQQIRL